MNEAEIKSFGAKNEPQIVEERKEGKNAGCEDWSYLLVDKYGFVVGSRSKRLR